MKGFSCLIPGPLLFSPKAGSPLDGSQELSMEEL